MVSDATAPRVVVHVHVPKMAGSTVFKHFPAVAGIDFCPWQSVRWPAHPTFGNTSYYHELLAAHCGHAVRPACFSSYEAAWDDVLASCRRHRPAAQRPVVLTMLRSPMAWLFSSLRWNGVDPAALARSGHWRSGHGIDRPLCALSGRRWCSEHPGVVDASVSRTRLVAHILRNLNHTDAVFGLAEEYAASMLLLLSQLGFRKRARAYCDAESAASVSARDTKEKLHSGSLQWTVSYDQLQALIARMATYQEVYSRASALFYLRLARARRAVCGSGPPNR